MDDGQYKAKPVEWALGQTSNGAPQYMVQLVLSNGSIVTWYGSLNGGAVKITVEALRLMGWKGKDISNVTLDKTMVVMAALKTSTYNGKTRQKCDGIFPVGLRRASLDTTTLANINASIAMSSDTRESVGPTADDFPPEDDSPPFE